MGHQLLEHQGRAHGELRHDHGCALAAENAMPPSFKAAVNAARSPT